MYARRASAPPEPPHRAPGTPPVYPRGPEPGALACGLLQQGSQCQVCGQTATALYSPSTSPPLELEEERWRGSRAPSLFGHILGTDFLAATAHTPAPQTRDRVGMPEGSQARGVAPLVVHQHAVHTSHCGSHCGRKLPTVGFVGFGCGAPRSLHGTAYASLFPFFCLNYRSARPELQCGCPPWGQGEAGVSGTTANGATRWWSWQTS